LGVTILHTLFGKLYVFLFLTILCHESFAACVAQEFSGKDGDSYVLKNTCTYLINVKYMFSESKPFSGTYTTLRAGEKTFESAKTSESARYYQCKFPGVPQTLNGGCVGGENANGIYGEIAASDQAEKTRAAEEKRRKDETDAATAEATRQQAEIDALLSSAQANGSLKPDYSAVPQTVNPMAGIQMTNTILSQRTVSTPRAVSTQQQLKPQQTQPAVSPSGHGCKKFQSNGLCATGIP
jgi:hypothetical protein